MVSLEGKSPHLRFELAYISHEQMNLPYTFCSNQIKAHSVYVFG